MAEEIIKNSGGIGLYQIKLKSDGTMQSGFQASHQQTTRHITSDLVERAFTEARRATPIIDESRISTGCVQRDNTISEFYVYKNKKFIGSPELELIFSERVTIFARKRYSLDLTRYIPIILFIILFIALYYYK